MPGALYLMKLKDIDGIAEATVKKVVGKVSSFAKLKKLSAVNLSRRTEINLKQAQKVKDANLADIEKQEKELNHLKSMGYNIYCLGNDDYPELLSEIYDPPPVIFSAGKITAEDYNAVTVVGTRRATGYGRAAAKKISGGLAELGITVISGAATGIDREAHLGAINSKGRTIGVLGGGLDRRYPRSNYKLMDDISKRGALISEFPCKSSPRPYNFPKRNRIISGLSLGVVVVEAPARSGALITAYQAMEQNRSVYAVPGSIFSSKSAGCAKLIKEGAIPVTSVEDIIEDIKPQIRPEEIKSRRLDRQKNCLSKDAKKIIKVLKNEPLNVDKIHAQTKIGINIIISELTILEMAGEIEEIEGKRYIKTDEL